MADERTVFAGDLTTDALGKRVRVTTETGVVVEDVLIDIRYFIDNRGQSSKEDKRKPVVWLRFENAIPANSFYNSEGAGGFTVEQYAMAAVVGSTPEGTTP